MSKENEVIVSKKMDVVNIIGELIIVAGAAITIPDLFNRARRILKK